MKLCKSKLSPNLVWSGKALRVRANLGWGSARAGTGKLGNWLQCNWQGWDGHHAVNHMTLAGQYGMAQPA
eukprot:3314238-Karenia_brevis.AAC.1